MFFAGRLLGNVLDEGRSSCFYVLVVVINDCEAPRNAALTGVLHHGATWSSCGSVWYVPTV